jgi:hypothetical protein
LELAPIGGLGRLALVNEDPVDAHPLTRAILLRKRDAVFGGSGSAPAPASTPGRIVLIWMMTTVCRSYPRERGFVVARARRSKYR